MQFDRVIYGPGPTPGSRTVLARPGKEYKGAKLKRIQDVLASKAEGDALELPPEDEGQAVNSEQVQTETTELGQENQGDAGTDDANGNTNEDEETGKEAGETPIEETKPEFPKHVGGGWWLTEDGRKVRKNEL